MDSNSNNNMKPCSSISETSNSKGKANKCNNSENRRNHTKRDRSVEGDGSGEVHSYKKRESSVDKENRSFRGEQSLVPSVQASGFPSYNYNSSEHVFVDNNRHALSMMSTYNMMANVNTPWAVNSFDSMAMSQHNVPVNQNQAPMPMATGLEMVQPPTQTMNPYTFMGIAGENMYGVVGMGNYCQYGGIPPQENMFFPPVKEIVQLTNCILYPPGPNASRPTTRERPLGCKTIFVGGLPEKITEEILKEIFERCGTVETIRMSKKNFCHIRFSEEMFVENALYFSGYRLKIENKDEAPFTGQLHVDYSQARDDQYEYECKQRALQRQARHQEIDYYRPPTPPVVRYSDHEASLICEKLKNEETFAEAAGILITWLVKGKCTKTNASSFFSMIQSSRNPVRKLQEKYEEQLIEAKMMLKKQLEGSIQQLTEIENIYKAASLQKCWDKFTKAQRKNIEMWKKQTEELKNAHLEEVINEREDEEMELSDDENDSETNIFDEELRKQHEEVVQKLQDEVYSLRCQLEAAQQKMNVMEFDHNKQMELKDSELASLREALQTSKKEELNLSKKCSKVEQHQEHVQKLQDEVDSLRCQLEAAQQEINVMESDHKEQLEHLNAKMASLRQAFQNSKNEGLNLWKKYYKLKSELKELQAFKCRIVAENPDGDIDMTHTNNSASGTSSDVNLDRDVRFVCLISTFLHVLPFGANIDYICFYLQQIDSTVRSRDVENLLKRYPIIFREDSTGIGASLGKKWRFIGF